MTVKYSKTHSLRRTQRGCAATKERIRAGSNQYLLVSRRVRSILVTFVVLATFVVELPRSLDNPSRQHDVSEADLGRVGGGRVVSVRLGAGGASQIVRLPVEQYVARVLAAEGEPRAEDAAQQALAIAIRTFAAANAGRHRRDGFDLCSSTHCQVLRPSTPASRRAAQATAGRLLTHDGRPAVLFYSASCGGRSEAASQVWPGAVDYPYLRSVKDDVHRGEALWTLEIPLERVEKALRGAGFDGRRLKDVTIERRSASGRVTRLQLSGMRPDAIGGDDFRAAVGSRQLRSTQFTVRRTGNVLRFTGRGYGHGVGMCIVGAGLRAARSESVTEILDHYFPGLRLEPATSLSAAQAPGSAAQRAPERSDGAALLTATRVRDELARTLGISNAPSVQLQVHESLDAFRQATGRPWWVGSVVQGSTIVLAPLPALAQGDGVEGAIRRGVAEALVGEALSDRPAWVRVGAARYYASTDGRAAQKRHVKCPSDAELTLAVSAAAHRDAELRAEACFSRALERAADWRAVR